MLVYYAHSKQLEVQNSAGYLTIDTGNLLKPESAEAGRAPYCFDHGRMHIPSNLGMQSGFVSGPQVIMRVWSAMICEVNIAYWRAVSIEFAC